jgi:hypothetical protein
MRGICGGWGPGGYDRPPETIPMTDRNRTDVKVIFALTLIHFAGDFYVSLFLRFF